MSVGGPLTSIGIRHRRPFKVIVCVITLWSFLFNIFMFDLGWADNAPAALSPDGAVSSVGPVTHKDLNAKTFTIPEYLGHVKDAWVSPNQAGPTIVQIQDAHCNYAAQRKISDIVDYLNREYGITAIALEGGAEGYDLSAFTAIKDPKVREMTADYFVKEGLVNGSEYLAINNADKFTLWGIEDPVLYMENLKVYRDSLKSRDEVDRSLKSTSQILSKLKMKIYSKELLDLDVRYSQYKADNINFKDYLAYLLELSRSKKIDLKPYNNIDILNETLRAETSIDFKKANNQRDELIDALNKKLSRIGMEELVVKTVEFKSGRLSQNDFYVYLLDNAKKLKVDMAPMEELLNYFSYMAKYSAIDKMKVIEEMDALELALKEALFTDDAQRKLAKLSKDLAILKNIFNVTLTPDDYRYYKANESAFSGANFTGFIKRHNEPAPISEVANLDRYRKEISKFYEYSFKRDDAFLKNIMEMNIKGLSPDRGLREVRTVPKGSVPKAVIVVTGGFHTDNLCELFRKKGLSYVSIIPNFTNGKDYKCQYFNLLGGNLSGISKMVYDAKPQANISMMAIADPWNSRVCRIWPEIELSAISDSVRIVQKVIEQMLSKEGRQFDLNIVTQIEVQGNVMRISLSNGETIQLTESAETLLSDGYSGLLRIRAAEAIIPSGSLNVKGSSSLAASVNERTPLASWNPKDDDYTRKAAWIWETGVSLSLGSLVWAAAWAALTMAGLDGSGIQQIAASLSALSAGSFFLFKHPDYARGSWPVIGFAIGSAAVSAIIGMQDMAPMAIRLGAVVILAGVHLLYNLYASRNVSAPASLSGQPDRPADEAPQGAKGLSKISPTIYHATIRCPEYIIDDEIIAKRGQYFMRMLNDNIPEAHRALEVLVEKVAEANQSNIEFSIHIFAGKANVLGITVEKGKRYLSPGPGVAHIHPIVGFARKKENGEVGWVLRSVLSTLAPSPMDDESMRGDVFGSNVIIAGSQTTGYYMLFYDLWNVDRKTKIDEYTKIFKEKGNEEAIKYLLDKGWGKLYRIYFSGSSGNTTTRLAAITADQIKEAGYLSKEEINEFYKEFGYPSLDENHPLKRLKKEFGKGTKDLLKALCSKVNIIHPHQIWSFEKSEIPFTVDGKQVFRYTLDVGLGEGPIDFIGILLKSGEDPTKLWMNPDVTRAMEEYRDFAGGTVRVINGENQFLIFSRRIPQNIGDDGSGSIMSSARPTTPASLFGKWAWGRHWAVSLFLAPLIEEVVRLGIYQYFGYVSVMTGLLTAVFIAAHYFIYARTEFIKDYKPSHEDRAPPVSEELKQMFFGRAAIFPALTTIASYIAYLAIPLIAPVDITTSFIVTAIAHSVLNAISSKFWKDSSGRPHFTPSSLVPGEEPEGTAQNAYHGTLLNIIEKLNSVSPDELDGIGVHLAAKAIYEFATKYAPTDKIILQLKADNGQHKQRKVLLVQGSGDERIMITAQDLREMIADRYDPTPYTAQLVR